MDRLRQSTGFDCLGARRVELVIFLIWWQLLLGSRCVDHGRFHSWHSLHQNHINSVTALCCTLCRILAPGSPWTEQPRLTGTVGCRGDMRLQSVAYSGHDTRAKLIRIEGHLSAIRRTFYSYRDYFLSVLLLSILVCCLSLSLLVRYPSAVSTGPDFCVSYLEFAVASISQQ